jgi:hypothetical protein
MHRLDILTFVKACNHALQQAARVTKAKEEAEAKAEAEALAQAQAKAQVKAEAEAEAAAIATATANSALALQSPDEADGVAEGKQQMSSSEAEPRILQEGGVDVLPEEVRSARPTEEVDADDAASTVAPSLPAHAVVDDLSTETAKASDEAVTKPPAPSAVPSATPSSPNPSFSSLRGRPTPPGTSDARSPSTSQPPSLRNAEGAISLAVETSEAVVPGPEVPQAPAGSHLSLAGSSSTQASEEARLASSDSATAQAGQRQTSIGSADGSAAAAHLSDSTIAETVSHPRHSSPGETDDDLYGQPSPRPPGSEPAFSLSQANEAGHEGPAAPTDSKDVHDEVNGASKTSNLFLIKVGDPHKVGESMTGHILYTVRTQVRTQPSRLRPDRATSTY